MGDFYAKALSKGLQHMAPEVVNFSDNRLSEQGSLAIIKKLKPSIKYLDLSENVIAGGAGQLASYMKQKAVKYFLLLTETVFAASTWKTLGSATTAPPNSPDNSPTIPD
jgi:hypothetical protein